MDKQQLLSEVRQMAAAGELTREEVLSVFVPTPGGQQNHDIIKRNLNLAEVMYYIGGAIVFLGICVLIYQNWEYFDSAVRILVTFGSFVAAFAVGALLNRYQDLKKVSQAFFLLSGLLGALGMNILFKELSIDIDSDGIQCIIYAVLTAWFLLSLKFFRQTILLFFGIVFASGLFHFIINLIVGQNLLMENYSKIWEYRFLVDGLAWVAIGYYLKQTSYAALSGALYGFGVLGVLGSTLALGGWQPSQNVFWELIYPLIVFGVIFASVVLKSKSFLVFGTIFLIAYILKLTGEYFTSGFGWPLALVLAGLMIMAVGYYAVKLNKKYFARTV